MNVSAICVLVATLTIFTAGITSEVSAVGFTITMETDKTVYDHASVITVTGNVEPVDPNGSDVTIIIERAVPSGIAGIAQVSVNSDGDFSTTINTATGSMKYDTTYLIKAQYVDAEITVSIELTAADETYSSESVTATTVTPETETSLSELVGGGPIEYDLTCSATSPTFWPNADDSTLEIHMDAIHDGTLTITLHEEVIKPFGDGTFFVFVNGEEVQDFVQDGNTLIIPCKAGDEKIEIVGSWAVPEFGTIAAMILVVAIVAIIAVSAKTKLSLVPKY
ncbi:PEFG-CTERM sorting domain-containing protein [Marine Group I thaumarchaeote]|nr:PEFG-CTERM sorting domain-containing protein [Marine Group I thaumarchaeote]